MTEADDVAEIAPEPVRSVDAATARVEAVDIHPPTRLERSAYGAIRGAFALLAKPYFRLEIHGREHVPTNGPFVLAPVHRSNLDFILVSALTRTRMRYMGKEWQVRVDAGRLPGAPRLRRPRRVADVSRGDRER
jgi:hypothetical protein